MEKPTPPVKPKLPKLKRPANAEKIIGYVWSDSNTDEIEFFDFGCRYDFLNQEHGDETGWRYHIDYWYKTSKITLSTLEMFAEAYDIDVEDIDVYIGSDDCFQLEAMKVLSKEVFAKQYNEYEKKVKEQEALKKKFEIDQAKYRVKKAEYDLWEAKQKLDAMKE